MKPGELHLWLSEHGVGGFWTRVHAAARTYTRGRILWTATCGFPLDSHTDCGSRCPSVRPLPLLEGGFWHCATLGNRTLYELKYTRRSKMPFSSGFLIHSSVNFESSAAFWPTYRSAQDKVSHGALYPEAAQRATGIRNESGVGIILRTSL